jgi:uncharacterized protein YoxC
LTAEQNKRINELKREIQRLTESVKTLELDMEPTGHITMGFDRLSEDIDEVNRRIDGVDRKLDVMSHQIHQVLARQEVILEAITKINDLPEE